MELRQLRIFAMAAELQNFTKTAAAMGVSQPAVSQQIATLEQELCIALFNRRGRRVTLTDAGQHMYEYTRKALELLDKAGQEIGDSSDVVSGTVEIACCTVPPESFLPGLLAAFRKVYPQIFESVKVSDSARATQEIEKGDADVGFVVVRPQTTKLRAKAVSCHELVLVVGANHRFVRRGWIDVEDLRHEQFILREVGSGTRQCVEQALLDTGFSPADLNVALETNSNDAIRRGVAENLGIAFLQKETVHDDLDQGRLVAVKTDAFHVRVTTYLVTDPQRVPTQVVRAFLDFIGE